jgi:hypothetical protein
LSSSVLSTSTRKTVASGVIGDAVSSRGRRRGQAST